MKTALLIVSVAAAALWGGFALGYHSGERAADARWRSEYTITGITTTHVTALNHAPAVLISLTNLSR